MIKDQNLSLFLHFKHPCFKSLTHSLERFSPMKNCFFLAEGPFLFIFFSHEFPLFFPLPKRIFLQNLSKFSHKMDVLRRIMPRKMKRDQYSFELLKSSSNMELSTGVGPNTPLPRNFSHYDSIRIAPSSQSAVRKPQEVKVSWGGYEGFKESKILELPRFWRVWSSRNSGGLGYQNFMKLGILEILKILKALGILKILEILKLRNRKFTELGIFTIIGILGFRSPWFL